MKVILTKKAEYEFNEERFTKLEANIFEQLIGNDTVPAVYEKLPEVIVFENRNDYLMRRSEFDFDPEAFVYVNGKGQIFRQLRKNLDTADGTTIAEEDTGAAS